MITSYARATGQHLGLRAEALDLLRSGGIPKDEEYCRLARERARDFGDDEAVALWSRYLWRHYVRARYAPRRYPTSLHLVGASPPAP